MLALRLPSAVLFGVLLALLALWLTEVYGAWAGAAAALLLGLMPRFFAYAHLVTLDMPLAALTLAATYVYWKTIDRPGLRWALPFGLLWGLALGVKNGGWLLPLGLGLWTLAYYRDRQHLARLVLSGAVAAAVFIVCWPWLYHDTLARLADYAGFAFLGHADLLAQQTYYLGRIVRQPPWHYPLVMTAAVLPLTILLPALAGLAEALAGGKHERAGRLLALSALGPMLPFLLGVVAAYDGERLYLASFPFLAALAGIGLVRIADALWSLLWRRFPRLAAQRNSGRLRTILAAALLLVACVPPAIAIVKLHPYELSYYNEGLGGVEGATAAGLETTFWGDSYQGALDYLNDNVAPGGSVWADAYQVLWAYQDIGRLRRDIVVPGAGGGDPQGSDWALLQMRQSRFFPAVAALVATQQPGYSVTSGRVTLAAVYRLR